jgi:AraC family transcriptional regulator
MEHRIEQRAAFVVTGMQIRCVPGPAIGVEIPRLWDAFVSRMGGVPGRVGEASYGVCEMLPGPDGVPTTGPGPFLYTACVETVCSEASSASAAAVPDGMVRLTVPGGKFAVFTYRGPISAFSAFVEDLWRRVLPAAGLTPRAAPDFEEYGAYFHPERGPVHVWVPVA